MNGARSVLETREETIVIVIQSYEAGLSAVRTDNPDVLVRLVSDPALPDEPVLSIEFPAPTDDPAGRDVWCDAQHRDWTLGRAISCRVNPDHPVRLSLSFLDRNGVAYTSWSDLEGGVWQTVRIPFDQIRPNPYFQPPGADSDAPIDVSDVAEFGFAPHDETAGRLAISRFLLVE